MRILYVTTVGSTMNFFNSFIRNLLDEGHIVDIATNESQSPLPICYRNWGCEIYHIDSSRSPLNKGNFIAIKQLRKIIESNHYDIVHCHTPLAAMSTRFACRKERRKGTKLVYTAHGFHFYRGAPLKNWLLYYPVEKLCAHYTDLIITINKEDYFFASSHLKAGSIAYVPGVGIDLEKFVRSSVDKAAKRRELGIPEDCMLLLSVGELNRNKNHKTILQAIANSDIHYIIAGQGDLHNELQNEITRQGMSERVKLLGFRNDVAELCQAADIFVFPSFREGLPVSVLEAMACGLPCVVSNVRGNIELVVDGKGGFLSAPDDYIGFKKAIRTLAEDPNLRNEMGCFNRNRVKEFDFSIVIKELKRIYTDIRG